MSAYAALAGAYDALTYDVPYARILDFWEAVLQQEGKRPESVLDLACGTGSLSVLMAQKGYRVLGADMSEEMLTEAMDKVADLENPPFFVCQSMEQLRLPYKVDWIVSCLDSINYLTDPEDCKQTFRNCYESLASGGMFCFDVHSMAHFEAMDGQISIDETDDRYCVWRTEFEKEENILYYGVDLFTCRGESWQRDFEEHAQYAYTPQALEAYLQEAGFINIRFYGDLTLEAPKETTRRMFVSAVKE